MDCINHPGTAAVGGCSQCGRPFCANCLVNIAGRWLCGTCKNAVLPYQGQAVGATIECKEAKQALTYAIVGLFCFGIILEPIALIKAKKARDMIALNPQMTGSGKVTAATVIAIIGLVFWALGLAFQILVATSHH